MSSRQSLWITAAVACLMGGCGELHKLTVSGHEDRYATQEQPVVVQQQGYGPGYAPASPQEQVVQSPTSGQWQWGTTPDGYRTRIWIPDNSWKQPVAQLGYTPPAYQAPRFNDLYKSARGRYDTIRYPDGRLEHEWRADEPSTPLQGYWQIVQGPGGLQRVWVSGVEGTAGAR